jgi:uncharacterized protein YneF (UPF0154 family)
VEAEVICWMLMVVGVLIGEVVVFGLIMGAWIALDDLMEKYLGPQK